ncbi:MAG: hypothetical protein IPL79_15055 [Myxococcales bacterium]|nr:hypothetical protein [Myxococcales bacterium]
MNRRLVYRAAIAAAMALASSKSTPVEAQACHGTSAATMAQRQLDAAPGKHQYPLRVGLAWQTQYTSFHRDGSAGDALAHHLTLGAEQPWWRVAVSASYATAWPHGDAVATGLADPTGTLALRVLRAARGAQAYQLWASATAVVGLGDSALLGESHTMLVPALALDAAGAHWFGEVSAMYHVGLGGSDHVHMHAHTGTLNVVRPMAGDGLGFSVRAGRVVSRSLALEASLVSQLGESTRVHQVVIDLAKQVSPRLLASLGVGVTSVAQSIEPMVTLGVRTSW